MSPIIGVIFAFVLSLLGFGTIATIGMNGLHAVQASATASQLLIFNKAAEHYVRDNGAQLVATATATSPVTVSVDQLIAANYLPASYLRTNPYRQTWQLQVLQPSPGVLTSLVTSVGGQAIEATRLPMIAAQSGAQGGFVPYRNQGGDPNMSPANAYGAYGAWKVALTGFANPGAGHLASLLAFGNTQLNNSYLYRVKVPGHPELNAMQTDLSMTDTGGTAHDIGGVNTATGHTFSVDGKGQLNNDQGGSLELGGNNTTAGSGTPYIDFHLKGQGVQDYNVRMINDGNNRLRITGPNGPVTLQVDGLIQAGNFATNGTVCSPTGAIAAAKDASGMQFECLNGKWHPIGGDKQWGGFVTIANGSYVAKPTCPAGGTAEIVTIPASFTVDSTAIVNFRTAVSGNGWNVSIVDGNGWGISGSGSAVTYCAYQ